MPLQDPSLAKTLIGLLISGLLGVVGAMATFFYEVDSGKRKFTWFGMLTMTLVAFVVGSIAGEFIPRGENYYGLTIAVGVNAYPIYNFIRKQLDKYMSKL
jgi:uncharacterized membrane protein YeaQ/YmgE (transglycosylase-associated protein family)